MALRKVGSDQSLRIAGMLIFLSYSWGRASILNLSL
jgi:hypothetical protein